MLNRDKGKFNTYISRCCLWTCLATVLLVLSSHSVLALSIQVNGLFANGAILSIDGKHRVLRVGKSSPEGVLLVAADKNGATIEYEGQRQTMPISTSVASSYSKADKAEVRLQSGRGGHYLTPARINGQAVTVVVDTGATLVSLNLPTAKRLGINYRAGEKISLSTANGMATAYQVTLNSVTIGTVKVNNVEASISMGDFPQTILLGNSYLSRVEMWREEGVLVLQSRI